MEGGVDVVRAAVEELMGGDGGTQEAEPLRVSSPALGVGNTCRFKGCYSFCVAHMCFPFA